VAYMLLAAEREGLATLTYTPGKSKFLQKLLNLESNFVPVTILPLGYAAERLPKKRVKPGTRVFIDRVDARRALKLG
jgi:nitroreductase